VLGGAPPVHVVREHRRDRSAAHIRDDALAVVVGRLPRMATPPVFVKGSREYKPCPDPAQRLRQRLTVVWLFDDHLVAEGARERNPVGPGPYRRGGGLGVASVPDAEPVRGLVPRREAPPWIPTGAESRTGLAAVRRESLPKRTMFALSYDAVLRCTCAGPGRR
jgi:hypothetical protein